jgi:hypothetical protein
MPLPFILGLAGLLAGGAFGTYGGAKLGSWLKGSLSDEEQKAVERCCKRFGIASESDAKELPPEQKKEFVEALERARSKDS